MDGGTGGWTSGQLLDAAHDNGFPDLTARRLETWRHQVLLPRPRRVAQDGLHPVWLSPPGTDAQLITLCALHRRTTDVPTLRVLLWLRGYEQELPRIRDALGAVLDDSERIIDAELTKIVRRDHLVGDPDEVLCGALGRLARQITGRRGAHAIPPRVRSARSYRQRAMHGLLYLFYTGGLPPASVATGDDVDHAFGLLPRGRLDRIDAKAARFDEPPVGPWHDGIPGDLASLVTLMSLPALRRAIRESSDDDLLLARRAVAPLSRGLTEVARAADALRGWDKFLGFTLLQRLPLRDSDVALTAVVLSLLRSELRDNLVALVETLDAFRRQLHAGLTALNDTPKWVLEHRMTRLLPNDASRVDRVRNEFLSSTGSIRDGNGG